MGTTIHLMENLSFFDEPLEVVMDYLKRNSDLRDFSTDLERADCSKYPIASGGLADIYIATLHNKSKVAIKRMRSNFISEGKATKVRHMPLLSLKK